MQYRQFYSEEEARNFCESELSLHTYLHTVHSEYSRLIESSDERERETASYMQSEIDRIHRIKDYFDGKKEEGYAYTFVERGNGDIICNVDTSIPLSTKHPAFIKEFAASGNNPRHKGKWFKLWKNQVLNPSINGLFKLVYACKMEELVPDNVKLLSMIKRL